MSGPDQYTGLGRYQLCLDPSPHIRYSWRQSRQCSSGSSSVPIPHHKLPACALELSWPPTTILIGVISKLVATSAPPIESFASGAVAGPKPNRSLMLRGRVPRGVFPPLVRAQVTATACSLPRSLGVPLARWSRAELARRVAAACPVASVSPSTVGRWLQAEKIRPWRYRLWQHIHDPTAFLQRARPVLQLYGRAHRLLERGTWVVCVDEKTSIQARQAEQAPRPAARRHRTRVAPRYKRRGARHLLAALSVADGQVVGQCSKRKRFVDFQSFISSVLVPAAQRRGVHTIALILDNGTTHAPKQLEGWLREQAQAQHWGVTLQVFWLPTNASWLDQIEIWFSILQRKLLEPNHFASTDALEQAIADYITYYTQTAKPIKWTYTVEKLEQKLGSHL